MLNATKLPPRLMTQRRRVLQLGLAASVILAAAGSALTLLQPGLVRGRLTPASAGILHAIGRAVLDQSLPDGATERESALTAHVRRVDDAIAGLPAATRAELSRLLRLLDTAGGRLALTGLGTPWHDAKTDELQRALQSMRTSAFAARQQIYHALRDLTNAAYYSDDSTWSRIGYPGPQRV